MNVQFCYFVANKYIFITMYQNLRPVCSSNKNIIISLFAMHVFPVQ